MLALLFSVDLSGILDFMLASWFYFTLICPFFSFRCLLLVLESSRVEIAVLLNDVAYLKYEASKSSSSSNVDSILSKQRTLAIAFSLIEKIIRLVANMGADEGKWLHHGY